MKELGEGLKDVKKLIQCW